MENNELEMIKKEIEEVREQINTYIQYPEIFEDELTEEIGRASCRERV